MHHQAAVLLTAAHHQAVVHQAAVALHQKAVHQARAHHQVNQIQAVVPQDHQVL